MTDLTLNSQGINFARNQARLADFFREYSTKKGLNLEIPKDNYVAPTLLHSDILSKMIEDIHAEVKESTDTTKIFDLFQDSASPEEIQKFKSSVLTLTEAGQKVDASSLKSVNFSDYSQFVGQFSQILEKCEQIEGFQQFDFNVEKYTVQYAPSDDEIKIAINLFGTSIISVADNNKDLEKEPGLFGNNLWALYLTCATSTFGLQMITKNMQYYAQFIGATASQTTNLTTFFNLVQLFFSPFWLWLSDIIGRKPIFLIILVLYAISAGLMLIVPNYHEYQTQIHVMQGIRAFMGSAAIIAPLAFVIGSDLAPPKNRGIVTVLVNVATQIGSIFASALTIYMGDGKPYNTKSYVSGSPEYNSRSIKSYKDSHIWAMSLFIFSFVVCLIILRESHPRIIALRKLKKMGVAPPKTEEVKAESMWKCVKQMCTNKDIMLLFFAYWINLIGATNSRSGAQVFITHMYGFRDSNYAKSYANTAQIVCITVGALVSFFCTKPMIKSLGEMRMIIISQYLSIIESILNWAISMPLPKWMMYITLTLTSLTLVFCDAIFIQLVSMYCTPQNRGQILGIYQIGNSIGRTLSGFLTGKMYDYNIRDSQLFNTLFASVCLALLTFVRPPLQRTEMDAAAKRNIEREKKSNQI